MIASTEPWSVSEKETIPFSYKCELLFDGITDNTINNYNLPSDSYLVYYSDKDGRKVDICRASRMVDIFDLYYDRFGGTIRGIDYTKGRMNPKIWGQNKKKEEEVNKKK